VRQKYKTNHLNFQAEAEEVLPEQQMRFCRILAGIYMQTGPHIVGAPMAHYNAINGSRFKLSVDRSYLPVHGMEGGAWDGGNPKRKKCSDDI
jgi:hypothetical protein